LDSVHYDKGLGNRGEGRGEGEGEGEGVRERGLESGWG
jgi:hypothetical protein